MYRHLKVKSGLLWIWPYLSVSELFTLILDVIKEHANESRPDPRHKDASYNMFLYAILFGPLFSKLL